MKILQRVTGGLALVTLVAAPALAQQLAPETVAEVRVHGPRTMSDDEIVRAAGVAPGDEVGPGTVDAIASRLRATGRFDQVDVRKRYTTLEPRGDVVLILRVSERPGAVGRGGLRRALTAAARSTLVMPIVQYAEGHGGTYGARVTMVDVLGEHSRLSSPLTGGGIDQGGVELEKRLEAGWVNAVRGGVSASRMENQHYLVDDERVTVWLGTDRRITDAVRISAEANRASVRFGSIDERLTTYRLGLEVDTRRDQGFPRDAVLVRMGWQVLDPSESDAIAVPRLDARGFLGLFGRTVFAVRAQYQGASAPVPAYAQTLLGGPGSVRGHRVGARAGDRLATASAELRVPLNRRTAGDMGVTLFFDTGATFNVNERLSDTRFSRGAGVGGFLNLAFLTFQLDAAHDLRGGVRVHFSTSASF